MENSWESEGEEWKDDSGFVCDEIEEIQQWEFLLEQIRAKDPPESVVEFANELYHEELITQDQAEYAVKLMNSIYPRSGEG